MKKHIPSAQCCVTSNFFEIITMNHGMLFFRAFDEYQLLPPVALDEQLGASLIFALARSKMISVEDSNRIWNEKLWEKPAELREKNLMKQYGYKSKAALYQTMRQCVVHQYETEYKIQPSRRHQKPCDRFSANKTDGPFEIVISRSVSNAELGAALREGFSRCTGSD